MNRYTIIPNFGIASAADILYFCELIESKMIRKIAYTFFLF